MTEFDFQALIISGGTLAASIGAIVAGPLNWLDKKRKEDREFVEAEVMDIRQKIVDEIADVEADINHLKGNHRATEQAAVTKFELHSAELVRLAENARQTSTVVADIKAEMRAGFAELKHDGEKRHDAFLVMLREAGERQREAITAAAAMQATQFTALSEALREIRNGNGKS